ncbi:MAG: VanZ family protein [Ignavibacteriales bacterium]|nr:VanZ family protein [Ignavibacteriales bacterium]
MKDVLRYQLPPFVWILVTFLFAYFPDLSFNIKLPRGADKIVHAGVFFVLCWLVQRAFYHQEAFPQLKKSSFLGAFIFSCVYGILDEFHQDFLPDQSSNIYDPLAGAGGALLYIAIASMMSRRNSGDGAEPEG